MSVAPERIFLSRVQSGLGTFDTALPECGVSRSIALRLTVLRLAREPHLLHAFMQVNGQCGRSGRKKNAVIIAAVI
jgi:hypothetical protein